MNFNGVSIRVFLMFLFLVFFLGWFLSGGCFYVYNVFRYLVELGVYVIFFVVDIDVVRELIVVWEGE